MRFLLYFILLINTPLAFSQWELISPEIATNDVVNYSIRDVHFINNDTGYVVGSFNVTAIILRTQNAGNSWDTTRLSDFVVNYPNNTVGYTIDFPNNDSVGYVSCNGDVLKTTDYGDNWVSLDIADNMDITTRWYAMQFINKDTGFIAFQDGGAQFLRTLDGGTTWLPDPVMTGIRNFNEYNGIYTGCHGGWAILDEQTLTWNHGAIIPAIVGNQQFVQTILYKDRIIIIGETWSGTQYVYSDDMGVTWTYKNLNFSGLADVQMINDNIGYISGSFPGTIKTFDGGETWWFMEIDNLGTSMYTNFKNFCMVNDTVGYAVTQTGIYKTTNGAGAPQNLIEELASVDENNLDSELIELYPNPFTNELNLSFETLTNGKLTIFDVNGKIVYSETIKNTNSIVVNSIAFEAGLYFYKLVNTDTGLSIGRGKVLKR